MLNALRKTCFPLRSHLLTFIRLLSKKNLRQLCFTGSHQNIDSRTRKSRTEFCVKVHSWLIHRTITSTRERDREEGTKLTIISENNATFALQGWAKQYQGSARPRKDIETCDTGSSQTWVEREKLEKNWFWWWRRQSFSTQTSRAFSYFCS